jgi:hypothetical protein
VSQDVVQEFQIATVNFDQATSMSSNGAINIVTRSGGNEYHGSSFGSYRDHHLAAYPALQRDAANPDPFFRRAQFGVETGGPIRTDRAFLFGNYERHDQRGVMSVQPRTPEFAPLSGVFSSPYAGNQFSVRSDVRLSGSHNAFARYTHDSNRLFGPAAGSALGVVSSHQSSRPGDDGAHERVVAARPSLDRENRDKKRRADHPRPSPEISMVHLSVLTSTSSRFRFACTPTAIRPKSILSARPLMRLHSCYRRCQRFGLQKKPKYKHVRNRPK